MTGIQQKGADEERFELLFRTHRNRILTYLLRRTESKQDAADLLAETFLIAWRKLEDIPAGDGERLWLYGVARRVLANYRRHERVENTLAGELRAQMATHAEQHFGLEASPLDDIITDSLNTLSLADRELIELSAWEHLTPAEIARVVGMKSGTVRVRLHRIRRALAGHLLAAGHV
jgi:RNA polymerase sigma-70 factor (ECF subfamily)